MVSGLAKNTTPGKGTDAVARWPQARGSNHMTAGASKKTVATKCNVSSFVHADTSVGLVRRRAQGGPRETPATMSAGQMTVTGACGAFPNRCPRAPVRRQRHRWRADRSACLEPVVPRTRRREQPNLAHDR